jgi:hypothetical protein
MQKPIRILLQTTIPEIADDWHIGRFALLCDHLASLTDERGKPLVEVTARNRRDMESADPVLSTLDESTIDELWLFAVDTGNGLTGDDCRGITRFHERGGGLLVMRDHQDLGSSLCTLGGVGRAHYFHSKSQEPDASRHVADDTGTPSISWPNYHSGRNGDYQKITPVAPVHELLASPSGAIEFLPAHPHEGAVGVPDGERHARVIATGKSMTTDRSFNLAVAFERRNDGHGNRLGRAVAESSFHHFADYNWDIEMGCPSFVEEAPGNAVKKNPARLADVKAYVRNLALWLAPVSNH